MITVDNAAPFLLERRLIEPSAIVDGDLTIVDSARRNRNLKVISETRRSYLLKQPDPGDPSARHTVANEAAFYRLCHTDDRAEPVRAVLPALFEYLPEEGVLVIELVGGATPLWEYYLSFEPPAFPAEIGPALGRALGTFHAAFRSDEGQSVAPGSGGQAPWILWVHKPGPEILDGLSPANLSTLRILQADTALSGHLDAMRRMWRVETLIHNDVKSDNVLVVRPDTEGAPPGIRIVDWELVQHGDPAWDVGAVFHDFLLFWIVSVPLSAGSAPEEMLGSAKVPLASLHPAIRAFWREYRTTVGLQASREAGAFLDRAVHYAAARLIQSAYEQAQNAVRLPNPAVASLQVAANMLADPEDASLHLLGIPASFAPALHAV